MKKLGIRFWLAFLPTLLSPTGLYLEGDKTILGFRNSEGKLAEYSISEDKKGSRIIIDSDTANPFYIYVNRDERSFNRALNPPANNSTIEKNKLVSTSDEKILGIFHYLLICNMGARRFKIKDTLKILALLDQAILIRTGVSEESIIDKNKWHDIKNAIEEAKITREIELEQFKSSLTPITVIND